MRFLLILIGTLIFTTGFSQEAETNAGAIKRRKAPKHQFELSPASVWLNKAFFVGHRLKYQWQFKRGMRVELETNGTIFRSLDHRAKSLKEDEVFPLLNQSTAIYKMNLIGKGKTINRNKQKRFVSSLRLGYHFFQHSTPYANWDYWAYDSTVQEGISSIRSFQSHSISAGLGFRADKYKRLDGRITHVASHKWSLDYLGCVYYQLSSYSINDNNQYNIRNIPNPYDLRKSGARLKYNYTRYLKSYFGIHFGMEAVYVPFLNDYEPLTGYLFVPRGGERIIPLFTNVHLGVTFKI
ncbi:MAG: hypothetical protein P8P74_10095 [Crocinitomicaceae bacterium]|nr:hypothetical protein [Crocinitomicaceae bacterium]